MSTVPTKTLSTLIELVARIPEQGDVHELAVDALFRVRRDTWFPSPTDQRPSYLQRGPYGTRRPTPAVAAA